MKLSTRHHDRPQQPFRATAEWKPLAAALDRQEASFVGANVQRGLAWLFYAIGVAYYFIFARWAETPEALLFTSLKAHLGIAAAQGALLFLYWRLSNHIPIGLSLKHLQAKVPDESAVPVAVRIRQNGTITGYDEGYAWVQDGALFYRGLQMVFRLNVEDVLPMDEWPRRIRPDPAMNKPTEVLPVPLNGRTMQLRLTMLGTFENHEARRRSMAFQRALYDWLTQRPAPTIEPMLPPTSVHPLLQRTGSTQLEGIAAGLLMGMVGTLLLFTEKLSLSLATVESLQSLFTLAIVSTLTVLSFGLAYSQYRDEANRRAIFIESQLGLDGDLPPLR